MKISRKLFYYSSSIIFVTCLSVTTESHADCWRLPNGQTLTTNAGSTPPVSGAQRIQCSAQKQPLVQQSQVKIGVVTTNLGGGQNSDNCVLFARSKVPSLPTGMLNWDGKLRAVNSQTPSVGSVAMIPYIDPRTKEAIGHVAYIEKIEGNSLTIIEANFTAGAITRRTSTGTSLSDAANLLKIAGYFRP